MIDELGSLQWHFDRTVEVLWRRNENARHWLMVANKMSGISTFTAGMGCGISEDAQLLFDIALIHYQDGLH
jgi:hypothetical protein